VKPLAPHGLRGNAGAVVFQAMTDMACLTLSWEGTEVDAEGLFPLAYDRAAADAFIVSELFRDSVSIPSAAPDGKEWDGSKITIRLSQHTVGVTRSLKAAKRAVDGLNDLLKDLRKAEPITELATMYRDLRRELLRFEDDLDPLNVDRRARTGRWQLCS
jgi:hypothetical protein